MKSAGGDVTPPDYSNMKPPAEAAALGNKLVPYGSTSPVTHQYDSVLPDDVTRTSMLGDKTRMLGLDGKPAVSTAPMVGGAADGAAAAGPGGEIAALKAENEALKMMLGSVMGGGSRLGGGMG